jgi:hypothetical protein
MAQLPWQFRARKPNGWRDSYIDAVREIIIDIRPAPEGELF